MSILFSQLPRVPMLVRGGHREVLQMCTAQHCLHIFRRALWSMASPSAAPLPSQPLLYQALATTDVKFWSNHASQHVAMDTA